MTAEELLNALAIEAQLFFERKEHVDQREGQAAFGIGRGHATAQVGTVRKEFHPARAAFGAPKMPTVQEFFPTAFAGLFQSLGCREALHKHPRTHRSPVLKSFQRCGVILSQSMTQLVNESGALFDQSDFIAT